MMEMMLPVSFAFLIPALLVCGKKKTTQRSSQAQTRLDPSNQQMSRRIAEVSVSQPDQTRETFQSPPVQSTPLHGSIQQQEPQTPPQKAPSSENKKMDSKVSLERRAPRNNHRVLEPKAQVPERVPVKRKAANASEIERLGPVSAQEDEKTLEEDDPDRVFPPAYVVNDFKLGSKERTID